MAKIAVFGGTFNPIHNGHIKLIESFDGAMNFDEILIVPTNIPPHKISKSLVSGEHRMNMIAAAVKDMPKVKPCDIELKREGASYTFETVRQLKEIYPDDKLFFIVGSDMFLSFEKWRNFEEIFGSVTVCSAAREYGDYEKMLKKAETYKEKYSAECVVMNFDVLELSSTDVRQAVFNFEEISSLVPEATQDYIYENALYAPEFVHRELIALLKAMLKPSRFKHSLNVSRRAVQLAKIFGGDIKKAYTAGVAHDICKCMDIAQTKAWLSVSGEKYSEVFLNSPQLWHAAAGANYLKYELKIDDEDIINAVRYHTSARENMSRLEQIIYLADLTSVERNYPDIDEMREISEKSLEDAMLYALKFIVGDLAKRNLALCEDTVKAYNRAILNTYAK